MNGVVPGAQHGPEQTGNVAATNELLNVIEAEAAHPHSVISSHHEFPMDDRAGVDLWSGPQMEEIPDPSSLEQGYLVGLRPDGVGQVTMLDRTGYGGVVGRVALTLRRDQPTVAFGERQESTWLPPLTLRDILEGQPVDPELLRRIGAVLPAAFEAKRRNVERRRRSQTALGKTGLFMADSLGLLRRRRKESGAQPKALEQ